MNKRILRAFVAMGALATACASWGCVADRPSRNGVFNENQYIRKDFLIRPATGGNDPGWFMKATLVSTSTPNPLLIPLPELFNGTESAVAAGGGAFMPFVRFVVTSDKLQVVNMRDLNGNLGNPPAQGTTEPEVVNAWPITNVDLKYEINLDGEITNFFQTNQEADWQQRQWVQVNFDKNDMSDIAPLGERVVAFMEECTDSNYSTTLVPNSFLVDETNNYMTWQVQMTFAVNTTDATCVNAYGTVGQTFMNFGAQDVSMTMMYSFARVASGAANSATAGAGGAVDSGLWSVERGCGTDANGSPTCTGAAASKYIPWIMAEKDPSQRKYGLFHTSAMNRDPNTLLLTSQAYIQRWNPFQQYTLYLAPGYPQEYEVIFCGYEPDGFTPATGKDCGAPHTGGIVDQTNQIFKAATTGHPDAKIQMNVMHNDDLTVFGDHANPTPKVFGDVRYGFIRWITDLDASSGGLGFIGVTEPISDPRSGELLTATVNIANFGAPDFYVNRLEFYLSTIGGNGASQEHNPEQIVNNAFAYTPSGACVPGAVIPFSSNPDGSPDNSKGGAVQENHNAISTVFQKMQTYLHKPLPTYGYLGPDDFIPQEDTDFFSAFFKIIPYQMFKDPNSNPFVVQEGGTGNYAPQSSGAAVMNAMSNVAQFNTFMAGVDKGYPQYSVGNGSVEQTTQGSTGAAAYTGQFQSLSKGMTDSRWTFAANTVVKRDEAANVLSYLNKFENLGRRCVQHTAPNAALGNQGCTGAACTTPHWETLSEWVNDLTLSTWEEVVWHEFGHSIGLDHNFMGSVDRNNFSTYCLGGFTNGACSAANTRIGYYASSIMEYPSTAADLFPVGGAPAKADGTAGLPLDPTWNGKPGWMPYDTAALGFIYANALTPATAVPNGPACTSNQCSVSGQFSATKPWADPLGWNGTVEDPYLWCTDSYTRYTPFCQTFDFGTTPSEIIASALDEEEWQYKWRNFRLYHKYWDDSGYAAGRAFFYHDILRFLSSWANDWSGGNLPGVFAKLGINPPNGVPQQDYYENLVNEFQNDISVANQLAAAYQLGMVEQASGERPFVTSFDPVYGDVTQQGIIIDKNYALNNFTTLYEEDNYDVNQAAGAYLFAGAGFDSNYGSVTQNVINTFVGGQYDVFPYDLPLAVQNFAATTQNLYFANAGGTVSIRDWIGGKTFGGAELDPSQGFLDWARYLAAQWGAYGCTLTNWNDPSGPCTWDPRQTQNDPNETSQSDPYNEFRGPDNRRYAWAPIADRNQILLVDRDWNTATYVIVRAWNTDVTYSMDDGAGGNGAYQLELPMKYFLNAYNSYN